MRPEGLALYQELCKSYEDHLPLHLAHLNAMVSAQKEQKDVADLANSKEGAERSEEPVTPQAVLAQADRIISSVGETELLAYFGTKHDMRHDASKIRS